MPKIRRRAAFVAAVAATTSAGLLAWTMIATVASAAVVGCQVTYAVPSQWGGGFTANITIKNVGDPINSWSLKWTFPAAGQSVAQGWNASYSQSGSQVTATNLSYNGSIPTQGSTSIGFNGSWSGSNPAPTTFTLNGVTCTGSVT